LETALVEWQLAKRKDQFTANDYSSLDQSWHSILPSSFDFFSLNFGNFTQKDKMEEMLARSSMLYFPADRFEPPDWLNLSGLSPDLALPESQRMRGRTARRIISKNRLKGTLDWLFSVIFDVHVVESTWVMLPGTQAPVRRQIGNASDVDRALGNILKIILCSDADDVLQFGIGDRHYRVLSAAIVSKGSVKRHIKDLISLSAGESALLCVFASIMRDADLARMPSLSPDNISGIVVIDEADLHLHVAFQNSVLPKLIAMFPRIQFIISLHSPMAIIGMQQSLSTGFEIRELPSGAVIDPEGYSEFRHAFDVLSKTRRFQNEVVERVRSSGRPILLVEGKTDASILDTAWQKLHPGEEPLFDIVPCGVEPQPEARNGGAEIVRRSLEFLSIVVDKLVIGMFDDDRAGNEQFCGLEQSPNGMNRLRIPESAFL
jgi:hypothetical protein